MTDSALESLRMQLHDFARGRGRELFHTPKNLAMTLNAAKYPVDVARGNTAKFTER